VIAAYPGDGEEGSVQGSWSLSERFQHGHSSLHQGALDVLIGHLENLRASTRCPSLTIMGDGCEGRPALGLLGIRPGPLRFAWLREDSDGIKEAMRTELRRALAAAMRGEKAVPPRVEDSKKVGENNHKSSDKDKKRKKDEKEKSRGSERKRRRKEGRHDNRDEKRHSTNGVETKSLERVCVGGFPSSWADKELRLVFALFGGIHAVEFVKSAHSRVAHVTLKTGVRAKQVVEKLDGITVGDGELMERCAVSCSVLEAPSHTRRRHHRREAHKLAERTRRRDRTRRRRRHANHEPHTRLPSAPTAAGAAQTAGHHAGAAAEAASGETSAQGEALVKSEIAQGMVLLREGRALAEDELLQEAYEKYVRGLQLLLRLDRKDPRVLALQPEVAKFVDEAEKLRDQLDDARRERDGSSSSCTLELHSRSRSSRPRYDSRPRAESGRPTLVPRSEACDDDSRYSDEDDSRSESYQRPRARLVARRDAHGDE